jgi:hypothetical protein
VNDDLMARMLATTHLVDCAEDWRRLADDPRLPDQIRHYAQGCADAIYAELGMKVREK